MIENNREANLNRINVVKEDLAELDRLAGPSSISFIDSEARSSFREN